MAKKCTQVYLNTSCLSLWQQSVQQLFYYFAKMPNNIIANSIRKYWPLLVMVFVFSLFMVFEI